MKKLTETLIVLLILLINTPIFCSPEIIDFKPLKDTIGRYEKFEVLVNLSADFQNPFDPSEIDFSAEFTSPSGKVWNINGFYNYGGWNSLWMVRFSPDETGKWQYRLQVKDKTGKASSDPNTFMVNSSQHHGPIRISPNSRYFQYDDGTPYYGVGLWYNDGYNKFNGGQILPEKLDELKMLGVNFISNFITPLETMGSGPGRYDQNICGRLDEILGMCEERDMNLSLNIWFHAYLSETVWPGGNRRWNLNPYQLVCKAKDFFCSKEAWAYQEKLYRYMIARWGYSRSLAYWFVVDEVNGTDGWASGDSLGANAWAAKVQEYFKTNDPYHHLTTGTRSGGVNEFWSQGYGIFDVAAREIYEAQGFPMNMDGKINEKSIHPLTLSYRNYANEINKLWNGYNKPAIIGETGWDHTFYEPAMPGYLALYHNALWVSLANGTASTPFWWAYSPYLNDNIINYQLKSFERFVSAIPFSKLTGLSKTNIAVENGDAFGMKADQMIFGWVVNPNADVTGAKVSVKSLKNGQYKLKIYHTWHGQFITEETVSVNNGSLSFMLPVLKIEGGRGHYLGQDAAFILEPVK